MKMSVVKLLAPAIVLLSPAPEETVSLWSDFQRDFAQKEAARQRAPRKDVFIDYLNLTPSKIDHSIPEPVVFKWSGAPAKGRRVLEIAEGKEPENARNVIRHETEKDEFLVYNLKAATFYCWRIVCGGFSSAWSRFFVADEFPRWINVPGATNVRDLGGYKTKSGARVRQGMIYRGSEFDRHQIIKPSGKQVLYRDIKLKTDLDLRGGTEVPPGYKPTLDPAKVQWVNIAIRPYDMIFCEEQAKQYAKILKLLADEKNYPVYFHCWGSADRGGTLAVLLEALLGIPESDILADYEFTTCSIFAERRVGFKQFDTLLEKLYALSPDLAEAAALYLISGGATREEIESFRRIMIEK